MLQGCGCVSKMETVCGSVLSPTILGIMVMVSDIIIHAGLNHRNGWLILQSGELQEVAVVSKMETTEIHRLGSYCQVWQKL